MKKLISALLACAVMLPSCEDLNGFLDENKEDMEQNDENSNEEGDENSDEQMPEEKPDIFYFKSEQEIADAVRMSYASLSEFIKKQISVESLYFTGGIESITPTNPDIEVMWQSGYEALYKANKCLLSLDHSELIDDDAERKYRIHCFAVIGYTTKTMSDHWGRIPLAGQGFRLEDELPNAMEEELMRFSRENLDRAIEEGMNTEIDIFDDIHVSGQGLMVAQAEVSYMLNDWPRGVEMCKRALETTEEAILLKIGNAEIYTRGHAEFMLSELSALIGIQYEKLEWNKDLFGYWYMLKRTGKLMEVTGCPEYKQALPVPLSALANNKLLMQNPGY
jgi:uncharacterized protein YbaR (Trm112 family)